MDSFPEGMGLFVARSSEDNKKKCECLFKNLGIALQISGVVVCRDVHPELRIAGLI